MKKLILLLFTMAMITTCIGQYTGKDFYLTFGGGLGYSLKEDIKPQDHAVDLYPSLTNYSTQWMIGFGMKVSDKIQVEINYLSNRKSLDDDAYDADFSQRYSDMYLYKKFDNSLEYKPGRLSARIFQLRLSYLISLDKIIITPTIAPGIGRWNQYGYRYILRQKNSNSFVQYELEYDSKIHFIYHFGVKFALKKWPNTHAFLNYTGDRAKHFYTVNSTSSSGMVENQKINFSSSSNIVSFGVNFMVTFEKKEE